MVPNKKYLLTASEMAEVDRFTIETLGLPGCVLMERAGKAVADAAWQVLADKAKASAVVLCGPGNNGGDGYVAARHLAEAGVGCQVFLLGKPEKIKGDARLNFEIWSNLGHTVEPFAEHAIPAIAAADVIIDAMLGTGAKGALREPFRTAAQAVNRSRAHVVAIDLPTGVDADTGVCDPDAVNANTTVTFGATKIGHAFFPGREQSGHLLVADIGFPGRAYESIGAQTFLIDQHMAAGLLPKRPRTAFKNRCGQVLVVAGSVGMDGAAALCSKSALAAGAGLVVLAAPAQIANSIGVNLHEVMKLPLASEDGMVAAQAWPEVEAKLPWASVVAAGPGLGQGNGPREIVFRLIEKFEGPLVIDADGLNALAGETDILKKRAGKTILTPHPGEFSRLSGLSAETIAHEPVHLARDFARKHQLHLLLKGAPSVAALPDGQVFVNSTGNPGMATAGMGDVLTGVLAGLTGQIAAEDALLLGMFVHSLAGDLAAERMGELSLTAGATIDTLGPAFKLLQAEAKMAY